MYVFTNRRALGFVAMLSMALAVGAGCKDEKKTESNAAAASQSAAPKAAEKASAAPAASSAAAPAASSAAPKAKKQAKKAPVEKAAPAAKKEVPAEWEVRDHEAKGFAFAVPKGVKEDEQSKDGVDVYVAQLPAPHDNTAVFVTAFKDPAKKFPELTKITEELIKSVDTGADYKVTKTDELSDSYQILTITYKDKDGKLNTVKALLALDVSDRYIMIVGGSGDMKAEEETVDTILMSFDMYGSGKE